MSDTFSRERSQSMIHIKNIFHGKERATLYWGYLIVSSNATSNLANILKEYNNKYIETDTWLVIARINVLTKKAKL
jgi:hypothetical protein